MEKQLYTIAVSTKISEFIKKHQQLDKKAMSTQVFKYLKVTDKQVFFTTGKVLLSIDKDKISLNCPAGTYEIVSIASTKPISLISIASIELESFQYPDVEVILKDFTDTSSLELIANNNINDLLQLNTSSIACIIKRNFEDFIITLSQDYIETLKKLDYHITSIYLRKSVYSFKGSDFEILVCSLSTKQVFINNLKK